MKKLINYIKKKFFTKSVQKTFKVKITKCENPFFWYKKLIGTEFFVEKVEGEELYKTVESNIAGSNKGFIKMSEAIEIKLGK